MEQNKRITELRNHLGLTMEAFGEKIGLTRQSISNIESGRRSVTNRMIMAISREFNVSEEWLERGTGTMFKGETEEAKYYKKLIEEKFASSDDSFRQALLEVILQLDDESIETVKKYALRFLLPAMRRSGSIADEAGSAAKSQHDEPDPAVKSQHDGASPLTVADELEIQRKAADYAEQLRAEKIAEAGSEASNITEDKKEA